MKTRLIETEKPVEGYQLFNPYFRTMTIKAIEKQIDFEKNWKIYGYDTFTLHRETGTVTIQKTA